MCLRTNMVQMYCISGVQAYDQLSAEESEKGGKYCGTLANPAITQLPLLVIFVLVQFFHKKFMVSWRPGAQIIGNGPDCVFKKGVSGIALLLRHHL